MSDEMKQAQGQKVYGMICGALDQRNWHYETDEENLAVSFSVSGFDLPVHFFIESDAGRQLVYLRSRLPFKMAENMRVQGAIATVVANYSLADGVFECDLSDGTIVFRMTSTYRGSEICGEQIQYMIDYTCAIRNEFDMPFLAINKGMMTIADFIAKYA